MGVEIKATELPEVLVCTPKTYRDDRGYFRELFHSERYKEGAIKVSFPQDNCSYSQQGVIRGLHYQLKNPQAKLVSVLKGRVLDVAVDIRKGSPRFGQWVAVELSEENGRQLFIPEGFAHGFSVLSEDAVFLYKCSALYTPGDEYGICFDEPTLAIDWQVSSPVVSERDRTLPDLKSLDAALLPCYPTSTEAKAVGL